MNISVCMATYNGEKYLSEQLKSILRQLGPKDEVIIVDDFSTDGTIKVIQDFKDNRICLKINDKNHGHVYSFNRSIQLSSNDIIFLSDQDDIWINNRVEIMKNRLTLTHNFLVTGNFELMTIDGNLHFLKNTNISVESSNDNFKNIRKIFLGNVNYFGCAMAFRKELKNVILPISSFVESHDIWIALAANLMGLNDHINEVTLIRRIHGNNVTDPNRSFFIKIKTRIEFILSIIILINRIRKYNKLMS